MATTKSTKTVAEKTAAMALRVERSAKLDERKAASSSRARKRGAPPVAAPAAPKPLPTHVSAEDMLRLQLASAQADAAREKFQRIKLEIMSAYAMTTKDRTESTGKIVRPAAPPVPGATG